MYCDGYFDEKRYSFLCNGSQGHSVPIINHSLQADGKSHYSTIKDVVITNDVDTFELDMTKAYLVPTLQELTRKFVWKKNANKELILSDSYLFIETPESIIERFIIPFIHITEDHDGIVLGNDQQLKILFDRNKLALNICENEFVNHFGEKEKVWVVDFTVIKPMKMCSLKVRFKFLDRLS
ncbi:hypothetical protein [Halalkalibacter alkalisediminis]|uniref:Uncharacterized protein n=1 Tax=Halalkalibacter alkalisediminis TaxID=935616 RepID=A0ABV6NN46_9BACI